MKIVEYAKAHPWATGIIVVVGGIIFISLIGIGGGGGGETQVVDAGPSDAEIMANAQIAAANINAQAATSAAQIGAGYQMNSDNLAAQVAMKQLDVQEKLGLATIEGQKSVVNSQISATAAQRQAVINSLGQLKKKNRDDVLQALVTGQPYYPQSNPGNSIQGILTGAGSLFQGASSVIPFL